MAKMGKFSVEGLEELQESLEDCQKQWDGFLGACAKELAARLLAKVIKRTPVGQYPAGSGKVGGTLRRGWTKGASAKGYADSLTVRHSGGAYTVEITNPVEYASYVEYGHRTVDHKGWVPGKFMMTISEKELKRIAPEVLESRIKKMLGGFGK